MTKKIWRTLKPHLCLALLVFSGPLTAESKCSPKSRAEILKGLPALTSMIENLMAEKEIDAISVAVIQNGEFLFVRGFGKGIGPKSQFQAASISKPVSAFATLKLVQQGKISLDRSLEDYVKVPYLPEQEFSSLVTARTVLNHTSGMSNDVTGEDRKIAFRPGSRFRYSGGGFTFLQKAIEDKLEKKFDVVTSDLLEKLRMKDSTFTLFYENESHVNAAYSLLTTPTDLALFLDQIAHPSTENKEISRGMTTATVDAGDGIEFGLGIGQYRCEKERAIRHGGRNFSRHHGFAVMFLGSRTGVVVMARGKESGGISSKVASLAIGGKFGD